ncbi:tail tube intiator [Acinetobacter phage vB_AbaP_Alexa]|nr:tail tube intiator [Acinetobacter phage vB_AbaP_Alexa]
MLGINAETGKRLDGLDHLRQSIRDILTTPIGSRVMRRDYGSRLFQLVDAPINRDTITDIYAATAEALLKWEPRVDVTQVKITNAVPGQIELMLYGNYLPNGQAITIDGIVIK